MSIKVFMIELIWVFMVRIFKVKIIFYNSLLSLLNSLYIGSIFFCFWYMRECYFIVDYL